MLPIRIPKTEMFDENTQRFIEYPETVLKLEHSLLSISEWESRWKKPFLTKKQMTYEETIDYIRCMTLGEEADPILYKCLTPAQMKQIMDYINDSRTATWFANQKPPTGKAPVLTSEVIYWQMTALDIPDSCEKWHLSRLFTLIHICSEKQKPQKKMGRKELGMRNHRLNEARLARLKTKG